MSAREVALQRTLAALALALLSSCRPPAAPTVAVLATSSEIAAGAPVTPSAVQTVRVPADEAAGLMLASDAAALTTLRPRIKLQPGDLLRPALFQPAAPFASDLVPRTGRRFTLPMSGAETLREGDHIDMLTYVTDQATHDGMSITLVQNVMVLGVSASTGATRPVAVALLPDEGEKALLSLDMGTLQATRRHPADLLVQEERGRATLQTLLSGERVNTLLKKRLALERPRPRAPAPVVAPPEVAPTPEPRAAPAEDRSPTTGPLAPTIEVLDR